MKLSAILKASCKSFSMKFLEVHHFLRNYVQYFAKEVNKILWKSFLVNKRKRFNTITVHLKCTTLLFLQKKAKIWACCVVARLGLPDFAEFGFVDIV